MLFQSPRYEKSPGVTCTEAEAFVYQRGRKTDVFAGQASSVEIGMLGQADV